MGAWFVLAAIGAFALWGVIQFNRMVALRNQAKNGFAQIDVQLKRRHDLVPNLVETARATMAHERETLEAVTRARGQAIQVRGEAASNQLSAESMDRILQAEAGLAGALQRLMVVAEAYPDLKASEIMTGLSEDLSSTENRIGFARQAYNDAVMDYNTAIEQFPMSIVATLTGFRNEALLRSTESAQERRPVRVSL
jgi:LemA protein